MGISLTCGLEKVAGWYMQVEDLADAVTNKTHHPTAAV